MAKRRKFSIAQRNIIINRASGYCEYCKTHISFSPDTFHLDHFIPLSQGGSDDLENIILACGGCNKRKSDFTKLIDIITGEESSLFNPRTDNWFEHFTWNEDFTILTGITSKGRVTEKLLELNRLGLITLRKSMLALKAPPFIKKFYE